MQLHEALVRAAELAAADVETVVVADGRLALVVLAHHAPATESTGTPHDVVDWSVVRVFYLCHATELWLLLPLCTLRPSLLRLF